jgi:hypothetical protein
MVDSILVYELRKHGQTLFLNECTAAYRLQKQGNWSMKSDEEKKLMTNKIHAEIRRVNYIKEVVIKK